MGLDVSHWNNLSAGVPQGGILSPLLFSSFINSLPPSLGCSYLLYLLYADDLQIYVQTPAEAIESAISQINSSLSTINTWSSCFGIAVNPSKCQAMVVGGSKQIAKIDCSVITPITLDSTTIPLCPSVKNLGLHIDSTLSWIPQVAEVSRVVYSSLRFLNRFRNFLPVKTKVTLVTSLILPLIDYADVCYPDLNEDLLNKLDRILNNAIRFIFCLRKFDHISSYRSQLNWLPIRQRRQLRLLCTLYTILMNPNSPEYLKSKFQYLCESHNERPLRSANSLSLFVLPSFILAICLNHSLCTPCASGIVSLMLSGGLLANSPLKRMLVLFYRIA